MSTAFFILAGATIFFSINTFIMLPRDRIPWPLPPGYTQVNMCRTKDDDNEVSSSSRLVFTQFIHAQYIIDAHFSFHHSPCRAPFHRTCHQRQPAIQWQVKWHSGFWLAMKHCCYGSCHWMASCNWWQVLWNGPQCYWFDDDDDDDDDHHHHHH